MNYLKHEFYQIIKSDENVFDFVQMNAFDGLWFWNLEKPNEKWINPKFCMLLGYEYEELQGNQIETIVYREDIEKIPTIFHSYKNTKSTVHEDDIRFVHKNGTILWIKMKALVFGSLEDNNHRVVVTHANTTKEHQQEDDLLRTLNRYESMLNTHSIFIIRTDMEGKYTYVNNHFCERFGLQRENIIGQSSMTAIIEEDHQKCIETVTKCFADPNNTVLVQLRKPLFDKKTEQVTSEYIYTDWEYKLILNQDGVPQEIQCVGIEVTEKVIAEKALQEKAKELEASEEELRLNLEQLEETQYEVIHTKKLLETCNEAAQIGTWELNLNDFTAKWNKFTKQIHEVDDDFVSTPENGILFFKEGYSREIITRVFRRALEEGIPYDEQIKIITAKGKEIWARAIGIPTMENGKCIELYGTIQNIDKQKTNEINLEKKLKELEVSQNQLVHASTLLETCNASANIGTWVYDVNTRDIVWDKIVHSIYELPHGIELDTPAKINFFKKGISRDTAIRMVREAREKGKPFDEELELINFRGNHKWVRVIGIPKMKEGRVLDLYGTFQDITPQKSAEIQLKEKVEELELAQAETQKLKNKLTLTLEKTGIGLWEINLLNNEVYWDNQVKKMLGAEGLKEGALDKTDKFGYVNEEDGKRVNKLLDDFISGKITDYHIVYKTMPIQEEIKFLQSKAILVKNEEGVPISVLGITQDITPQKNAEIQLKEKVNELEEAQQEIQKIQNKLTITLDNTGIGTWEYDVATNKIYWDNQVRKLFGVTEFEEITHEIASSKVPEKELLVLNQTFDDLIMQKISSYHVQYPVNFTKDTTRYYDSKAILIKDENNKSISVFGVTQDITQQTKAEIQLQQKVKELEKAQQEVKNIQAKLSLTLEKTGIGLWEIDLRSNETYWDKQTSKMFGVELSEKINFALIAQKIHAEDMEIRNQTIADLVSQKIAQYHLIYRTLPIDGKIRYHEAKATLLKDESENPVSVLGIVQDITEKKENENIIKEQNKELAKSGEELKRGIREMYHLQQDLKAQKQQLEQIFDAVPAMIYQFKRDSEGNVSFPLVSKGSELILGVEPKQILDNSSNDIFEAIHPDDLLGFQSSIKTSAETMQKWESELRILKNGKEVWIHATSKPTSLENGGIVWTGIMQNIDQLKETEHKIQQQNKQLQETLDELKTTQSQLIHNEKMTTLGQLVASIAHEINTPLGAIRSSATSIERMLKTSLAILPKTVKLLSDKQLEDFNLLIEKSMDSNYLHTSREKRRIKYELIDSLDTRGVPQADRISDILVDIGVHQEKELYEPFIQLPNAVQILDAAYQLATIARSNATVMIATEKASKIIITLKNFSRQDHTGEKQPTNINESLENTLVLYHNKLKYGIEVIRQMEVLPLINSYEDELAQVWTNLLHNAIQAIEKKGKIYLTTQKQDNKILVSLRDTGSGIPDEAQHKIFDAFFTTKSAGEGTGLGLNIVRKIIDKHEGKIWFETENVGEHTGTTFFVELPIK